MHNLVPTLQQQFSDYWVQWFKKSNTYSVITDDFKQLLDIYTEAENTEVFKLNLKDLDISDEELHQLTKNIQTYLENCNIPKTIIEKSHETLDVSKQIISKSYLIEGKVIKIYYDSVKVAQLIHPAIVYTETQSKAKPEVEFSIYLKNDTLYFFENKTHITNAPKQDYHVIQGKFTMYLINAIHNKVEEDWIGTFHASSVSNGKNAVMFIGLSGKGKSTLTTLCAAHGFELLADDVSPLLAENLQVYHNPSAVSIKKGAFNILKPYINYFDALPTVKLNDFKGQIKHVPFAHHKKLHYPCKAIILVNYKANSKTNLKAIGINQILETMIPDSWLQHNALMAQKFLDWLTDLSFYELTYSANEEAIASISRLLKES